MILSKAGKDGEPKRDGRLFSQQSPCRPSMRTGVSSQHLHKKPGINNPSIGKMESGESQKHFNQSVRDPVPKKYIAEK